MPFYQEPDHVTRNGALRLYERLGFRVMKRFATFERPMDKAELQDQVDAAVRMD